MGIRYTPEELTRLRDSPLVTKPVGLPPSEEWMGPLSDNTRNRDQSKTLHLERNHPDRGKLPLLDQTNRRPGLERHVSRGNTNPEDIILGPPKTSFASATSLRNPRALDPGERPSLSRELDSRDRFNLRKVTDTEEDRRNVRSNNLRGKRGEGDQDSDGWSTVKPRKSFGNEGAERFNGRMGGERHKDDRRIRDREDRDNKEKPSRGFDTFSRGKDVDQEQEPIPKRNGTGRGRNEPSWFKDANDVPPIPPIQSRDRTSNGEKFADRSRGWREKDREDKAVDRNDDRAERRWDRDRRVEREPEWMDEPADEKKQAHTQEDFQKWKERMKAGSGNTPAEEAPPKLEPVETAGQSSFFGLDKPKAETPLFIDTGPDKFFSAWVPPKQEAGPESTKAEGVARLKTPGKSSRFTSFFSPQEDLPRRQTDLPPPVPALPQQENNNQVSREKEDFQRLLQKLQSQSFGVPAPAAAIIGVPQPKSKLQEKQNTIPIQLQDSFQQYRSDRNDVSPSSNRNSQQALQDLLGQRQTSVSQPSSARPDQLVSELINQRQNTLSQSSNRQEQISAPNRNAEFLMGLMQNARAAPEPLRSEQLIMRMGPQQLAERQMQQQQQQQRQQQQQQMNEREQEMHREQRERSASQQHRRPDLQPGFYDEALFQRGPPQHEGLSNPHTQPRSQPPPQPTQILQRPPPGLDQLPPGWGTANAQLPPPMSQQQQQQQQQRHIAPPPGLPGGQSRGMPMPQNMFPPGFPMGGFGPPGSGPDGMMSGGPRNMPPPPGFMMPPPGFMGGSMAMGAGMGPMNGFQQGPEMAFGAPFDGRGGPQGGFRRQ